MKLSKTSKTGYCGHYTCPYSLETEHGYELVETFGSVCEAGLDCLKQCPYSYTENETERLEEAHYIAEARYGD